MSVPYNDGLLDSEKPNFLQKMKERTRALRREVFVLYLAIRHPATPWYTKALACAVVAYAVSPFDLIPDPIPVIGYLDDVVIVPLGILAVRRLIPLHVLDECRRRAVDGVQVAPGLKWTGGIIISVLWLMCIVWLVTWGAHFLGRW